MKDGLQIGVEMSGISFTLNPSLKFKRHTVSKLGPMLLEER